MSNQFKYFVYILYSATINKYYVGYTVNLKLRRLAHNHHLYKGSYTKRANDWIVYLAIPCTSKIQAIRVEKHIKTMKSRVYYHNLKNYPELVNRLLQRFKPVGGYSR